LKYLYGFGFKEKQVKCAKERFEWYKKQLRIMIRLNQFFPNPSSYGIPPTVNYIFPKSTKSYDQGQKMLFALN